ncbi:MAG: hypothetical protein QG599_376 [Pseudomonadota bacterium]|nr:hypothetical protein [Pseudomonadota bacterium]
MKFLNILTGQNIRMAFVFLSVFFITFFCYLSTLNNGFVWDDIYYILKNRNINNLGLDNIKWMFTSLYMSNWHPLTWLSMALDYLFFGHNPSGYHLTNVILHSLNSVLVLILSAILIKINQNPKVSIPHLNIFSDKKVILSSWIAALLFGIHPQHVESVAWISERKDVLSMFFTILTFLAYIIYARALKNRTIYYGLSLLFFMLALMAKPMAVTIPVLLLLLDVYPLQRTNLTAHSANSLLYVKWSILLSEKLPFFLFSLAVVSLTLIAQTGAMVDLDRYGLGVRLLNAFNSVIVYISKFLFPINLQPFYGHQVNVNDFESYVPLIACFLATLILVYWWFKKNYYLLIIWLFYLITLSPVIGIIQVGLQSSADRYAYLPTLPFYIITGAFISYLIYIPQQKMIAKTTIVTFFLVVIAILFFKTQQQITIWKNDLVFWNYVVHMNPENGRAQSNLGRIEYSSGNYEKAIEHFGIAHSKNALLLEDMLFWGESLLKNQQPELALAVYSVIVNTPVKIDKNKKSCIYYTMGCIYLLNKKITDAKILFESVEINTPFYQKKQEILSYISQFDNFQMTQNLPSCQFCFENDEN